MATMNELLAEYGESHQNQRNKLLHWICVPAIVWSVIALLWAIPFPEGLRLGGYPLNWALITLALAQLYYFIKSPSLGFGLLVINIALFWSVHWVALNVATPLWQIAAIVFVVAWIGQFIGHIFEGKRPSFFKDLQFLLIGPAWLLSFIYRKLGLPV